MTYSLIRLLSSEPPSEPIHSLLTSQAAGPATTVAPPSFSPDQTPSSPTSAGPPLPSLAAPLVPSKRLSAALPRLTEPAPTRSLSAYQALIQQPRLQRALAVRFIDTPGLDVQTDDGPAVHAYTRERGVMALLGMVEGQCEAVLREESKVSRKGTAGADELVHLCELILLLPLTGYWLRGRRQMLMSRLVPDRRAQSLAPGHTGHRARLGFPRPLCIR